VSVGAVVVSGLGELAELVQKCPVSPREANRPGLDQRLELLDAAQLVALADQLLDRHLDTGLATALGGLEFSVDGHYAQTRGRRWWTSAARPERARKKARMN
jgi:hypothetical protein